MKPHVDFTKNEDVECVVLAELGWETKAIAERLHLEPGQVAYRIKKAEASPERRAYRKGTSTLALKVLGQFGKRLLYDQQPKLMERFMWKP